MIPGGINPLLLAGGAVRVQDVFAIVLATGAGLQAAFDACGVDADLLIGKNRAVSADWTWRSAAVGLGQKMASNSTAAASAFSGYSGTDNHVGYAIKSAPDFYGEATVSHTNGTPTNVTLTGWTSIGMVSAKITNTTGDWFTRHRSLTAGEGMRLNGTEIASSTYGKVSWSGNTITLDASLPTGTYLVKAYGHNTDADGRIQAFSYPGNGSPTGPSVTLGWEPQFLMTKKSTGTGGSWYICDSARGFAAGTSEVFLTANLPNAEGGLVQAFDPTSTGFNVVTNSANFNESGATYVGIAIRAAA